MTTPEPDILAISRAFQQQLLEGEAQAVQEMTASYTRLANDLAKQAADLAAEIERMQAAGEAVPAWRVAELQRYQDLMAQANEQLAKLAADQARIIAGLQQQGLDLGMDMAAEQLAAMTPAEISITFNRLATEALQAMVGFLQDGSPLARLLADLGADTARRLGELLQKGLALGWNPRKLAAEIRRELGMALSRAMRIARTEQLRAWRESTIRSYRDQGGLIKGYRRSAAMDDRTCIACLLMDGHFYTLEENFTDHVQGRCAVIPVTKTWAELGYPDIPDTNPQWTPGRDWFLGQDEATQRRILGDGMYDAWQAGDISLEDMMTLHKSSQWGDSWQASSLKGAMDNAQNRVAFP